MNDRPEWLFSFPAARPASQTEITNSRPPGKDLNLGCGTGTHALTPGREWLVVPGIYFAFGAIRAAGGSTVRNGMKAAFFNADVISSGCFKVSMTLP